MLRLVLFFCDEDVIGNAALTILLFQMLTLFVCALSQCGLVCIGVFVHGYVHHSWSLEQ